MKKILLLLFLSVASSCAPSNGRITLPIVLGPSSEASHAALMQTETNVVCTIRHLKGYVYDTNGGTVASWSAPKKVTFSFDALFDNTEGTMAITAPAGGVITAVDLSIGSTFTFTVEGMASQGDCTSTAGNTSQWDPYGVYLVSGKQEITITEELTEIPLTPQFLLGSYSGGAMTSIGGASTIDASNWGETITDNYGVFKLVPPDSAICPATTQNAEIELFDANFSDQKMMTTSYAYSSESLLVGPVIPGHKYDILVSCKDLDGMLVNDGYGANAIKAEAGGVVEVELEAK